MSTGQSADDVFRLLSDEIRLDILRAVAVAQRDEIKTGVAKLSFSEIYEQVEVDNTSKLSYHLGELTGTFLKKHDDGYVFTHAGEQMVRFILSENFRPPPEFDPIEVDGRCLHCGSKSLQATLHEQYFLITCSECDRPSFAYRITPAQVRAHPEDDLVRTVAWEQAGDFLKMRQDICPDCAGRLETEIIATEEEPVSNAIPASFGTVSECQQCLRFLSLPLTHAVAYHPESVAFHWEHGVDIMAAGVWNFHRYLYNGQWSSKRIDTDPEEYRVELQRESDSLRLFVNGAAKVTRTERVRHREQRERG